MKKRVILIVLDSLGIGGAPDSVKFDDVGADTLNHIAKYANEYLNIPYMKKIGFANIEGVWAIDGEKNPAGSFGKLFEESVNKDTTTGHWELMGLILDKPFPTYPNGFPPEIIEEFKRRIGRDILGNIPASGTEIIKKLGEEHIKTGKPIVYTSADSVFQIAAHEEVVGLDNLYKWCEIAREILTGEHAVARVIARPFIGDSPENFTRTANRRDYSLAPFSDTVVDYLYKAGKETIAVGKIWDIFAHRSFSEHIKTKSNAHGMEVTIDLVKEGKGDFIFVNLVDFDMKFGHRRNPKGYALALTEFDKYLAKLIEEMREDDILMMTADHGCDPVFKGTDHTREAVPFVIYGKNVKRNYDFGYRIGFSTVGATIADILDVDLPEKVKKYSIKSEILK